MWVEIDDVDSPEGNAEPLNINPTPVLDFECRVVIWKTRKLEMMDVEDTTDAQIRAFFKPREDKKTDTHWRCQDGNASFNWRLVFPIKSQEPSYTLTIQAWDRDITSSNEIIGECAIPLDTLIHDACLTHKAQYINSKYFDDWMKQQMKEGKNPNPKLADEIEFDKGDGDMKGFKDRFWIPVKRPTDDDPEHRGGDILISVCLLPKDFAEKSPQGPGREEPNNDPYCPPPEGRISFTLNPFKMFA